MVTALARLFDAAGGLTWLNNSGWGVGEPCEDGWYGVYCCPLSMPYLIGPDLPVEQQFCSASPAARRRTFHPDDAENVSLAALPDNGAHFCSPGTSFGDDRDMSTCMLVQLRLERNNLTNTLNFDYGYEDVSILRNVSFGHLQNINMEGNALSGRFPMWITQLPTLRAARFDGNTFTINYQDELAIAAMCDLITCDGLPGFGSDCGAFGQSAVLLWPQQDHCYVCDAASTVTGLWWGVYTTPAFLLIPLYVLMVRLYAKGGFGFTRISACTSPHPTTLKGWVTCSCVLSLHLQTTVLIGNAQPYWPASVRRMIACLSLDYTCVTEPECLSPVSAPLQLHIDARAGINYALALVLVFPSLVLVFLVFVRALVRRKRRLEQKRGAPTLRSPVGADSRVTRFVQRASEVITEYMLDSELVCSVLLVALLAYSLRVARQLIDGGGSVLGVLLIAMQPSIYILYGRDALSAQTHRKDGVQKGRMRSETLRLAYLTQPFKDKAATWQLVFFVQHVLVFFASWHANTTVGMESNAGGAHTEAITVISLTLLLVWCLHTLAEPWEMCYQNTASSRLYACHFVTLGVSGVWQAYYDDKTVAPICEALLQFSVLWAPLLTIGYMWAGLRVSRDAAALTSGLAAKSMPIWIRGMRWEPLPLPAGTVAIACLYEGTPTVDSVYEALCASAAGAPPDKGEAAETRREQPFKRALSLLFQELAVGGGSGASLTAQVRRFGATKVADAQRTAMARAREQVLSRLEEHERALRGSVSGINIWDPGVTLAVASASAPSDAPAASAETADAAGAGASSSSMDGSVAATGVSISSSSCLATIATAAVRFKRQRALERAAVLTRELSDLLETDANELAQDLSADEMSLLRKLSSRGKRLELTAADAPAASTPKLTDESAPAPDRATELLLAAQQARSSSTTDTTGSQKSRVEGTLEALQLQREAVLAAADMARAAEAPLEDGAVERALEALDRERAAVEEAAKASRDADVPMEEGTIERALAALETQHEAVVAAAKLASTNAAAPRRNLTNDGKIDELQRESDVAAAAAAAKLQKERFADLKVEQGSVAKMRQDLAAKSDKDKEPPPSSPPPSPPEDARQLSRARKSRVGITDGLALGNSRGLTAGLSRGQSQGLGGGLGRGASRGLAVGLGSGAGSGLAAGLGQGDAQGVAANIGLGNTEGLAAGLAHGASKGLGDGLGRGDGQGLTSGIAFDGRTSGLADGLARGDRPGLASDLARGDGVGLATGLARGDGPGLASDLARGDGPGLAAGLARGDRPGIAAGLSYGCGSGLADGLARGQSQSLTAGLGHGQSLGLATGLGHGQSLGLAADLGHGESQSLGADLGRGQTRGIASGLARGKSRGVADAKMLSAGARRLSMTQGTVLAGGKLAGGRKKAAIAANTVLTHGEDPRNRGLTGGTLFERISKASEVIDHATEAIERATDHATAAYERSIERATAAYERAIDRATQAYDGAINAATGYAGQSSAFVDKKADDAMAAYNLATQRATSAYNGSMASASGAYNATMDRATAAFNQATDKATELTDRATTAYENAMVRGNALVEQTTNRATAFVEKTSVQATAAYQQTTQRVTGLVVEQATLALDRGTELVDKTTVQATEAYQKALERATAAYNQASEKAATSYDETTVLAESMPDRAAAMYDRALDKTTQQATALLGKATALVDETTEKATALVDKTTALATEKATALADRTTALASDQATALMDRTTALADQTTERATAMVDRTTGLIAQIPEKAAAAYDQAVERSAAFVDERADRATATYNQAMDQATQAYQRSLEQAAVSYEQTTGKAVELVDKTAMRATALVDNATAFVDKSTEQATALVNKTTALVDQTADRATAAYAQAAGLVDSLPDRATTIVDKANDKATELQARATTAYSQAEARATVAYNQALERAQATYGRVLEQADPLKDRAMLQYKQAEERARVAYAQAMGRATTVYKQAEDRASALSERAAAAYDQAATAVSSHPLMVKVREDERVREAAEFITKDLLSLHSSGGGKGTSAHRPGHPVLEREPPEPPPPPDRYASGTEDAKQSYLVALIEWLLSPADDVSQVKERVSPWPAKANRAEPGDEQLDRHMTGVLRILEHVNYGTGSGSSMQSGSNTRPLIELGYLVVLCMHQHRNARTRAQRAAQIRQRWFLAVIDWRTSAQSRDGSEPLLVMPNAYLQQWTGRQVRVKEPVYAGGVLARGSDQLVRMVRDGKAIIYDEGATSVFAVPAGVRVRTLHHSLEEEDVGQMADLLWGDLGPMVRNLQGSPAKLPFDTPLAELKLDVGVSSGLLLQELSVMAEDLIGSSAYSDLSSREAIATAFRLAMSSIARKITRHDADEGAALRELAFCGDFPKVILAAPLSNEDGGLNSDASVRGPPGVSVHLCASDIRRLAPDASREIVVWLTIVDLQMYNPVNAAEGGLLTPRREPIDPRETFLVPGELACPISAEEIDRRLEAEEQRRAQQEQDKLMRLQTSRLTRARAASSRRMSAGESSSAGVMPAQSPRDLFKSEASLAAAAGALATAELQRSLADGGTACRTSRGGGAGAEEEDVLDAMEAAAMEEGMKRVRSAHLNRATAGSSSGPDLESGSAEVPDRLNLGI